MAPPELLWTPTAERVENANLTRYQRWIESELGLSFDGYEALWRWSVGDLEGFWDSIAKFAGVRFERPASRVLGDRNMPGAEWFPGAYVNYAEHIFAGKRDEDVAIWSSAAPEFGARSVIDRFAQIEPKVLLAIDGYRYGGKDFDRREIVRQIAGELPGLERVVTVRYLDGSGWEDGFLGSADAPLTFTSVPFDHPMWVLYSSGT